MALLTSTSFSQNTSTAKMPADDGIASQGIRVSIVKPTLDIKATVKYQGFSFDGAGKPDSALGLAVGYAKLTVQEIGYTANLALIEEKADGSSGNIARADGNIGYAFNKYVNLKGGLNVMKFISGNGVKDLNPGLGYQASLGFQLNRNIGLDVGYSELNTSGKTPVTSNGQEIGKADIDVKMTGLEVGLNATF